MLQDLLHRKLFTAPEEKYPRFKVQLVLFLLWGKRQKEMLSGQNEGAVTGVTVVTRESCDLVITALIPIYKSVGLQF